MYPEGRKAAVTPKADPPARRAGRPFWGLELVLEQGLAVVTQMGLSTVSSGLKTQARECGQEGAGDLASVLAVKA